MKGFDQISKSIKKSSKKSILVELKSLSKMIKKDQKKRRRFVTEEPTDNSDSDFSHYDPIKNKNRLITEFMVNFSTNTDQNSNIIAVNPNEIQNDIDALRNEDEDSNVA